jgi:hypothetical protein
MAAFLKRLREQVDRVAAGSAVPAGQEPPDPAQRPKPTARERTMIRRRLRDLKRKRELMLVELGALTLEQHRRDRFTPGLVEPKTADLESLQAEVEALEAALAEDRRVVDIVAAGIAGSCPSCGALASAAARFCESCGAELSHERAVEEPATETLSPALPRTVDEDSARSDA